MLWMGLFAAILASPPADASASGAGPNFAEFDRRAREGERLSVVFLGASLTWGANATDPQLTSYRGLVARRMEAAYPRAHLTFRDAAIGGTGSQLGVFRLDRDVLRHKPDLVFLDFSANDDIYSDTPETLASYEAIVRRILIEAKAPVVQVIFPFRWNVEGGKLDDMKRRTAHLALGRDYRIAIGDAIAMARRRVEAGEATLGQLWPVDGVHPGDAGYALFADSAWDAFREAVEQKRSCTVPETMRYADTYLHVARARLTTLGPLPEGWATAPPDVVSAYFDMLMSRWQGEQAVAIPGAARLKLRFRGSMAMLFGESTPKSAGYRAWIDGKPAERREGANKPPIREFDAGALGRQLGGNTHLVQVLAEGLDPKIEHTLELEPIFSATGRELRIESVCVAGEGASVSLDERAEQKGPR